MQITRTLDAEQEFWIGKTESPAFAQQRVVDINVLISGVCVNYKCWKRIGSSVWLDVVNMRFLVEYFYHPAQVVEYQTYVLVFQLVIARFLKPGGLFFMEMYGGSEARTELEDEREVENFIYVWDQDFYNPINHHTRCYIHFRFPDGSELQRAFTYEWRVWSLPELQELLVEAGFENVRVFWETVDEDEDDPDMLTGTGEYEEVTEVENQDSWLVYVVGERAAD